MVLLFKPSRLFIKNISIESPRLTPDRPVGAEDLVSADGGCPGMAPPPGPADANASTTAPAAMGGTVALGHTECDVVRAIAVAPDNVNLSNNPRGDRVALITWMHGPRPGAYTFTSGRLTSIERVDVPPPEKPARGAKKKRSS
jgi:hypothetical protein